MIFYSEDLMILHCFYYSFYLILLACNELMYLDALHHLYILIPFLILLSHPQNFDFDPLSLLVFH
jgi:hypothetical protein